MEKTQSHRHMSASRSPVNGSLMKDLFFFQEGEKDYFHQHEIIVTLYSKVCLIFSIYFHLSTLLMTTRFFIKKLLPYILQNLYLKRH